MDIRKWQSHIGNIWGSLVARLQTIDMDVFDKKEYTRNIFSRFKGLDFLFEKSTNMSVLDIGTWDGLISYEFARHGARLIHGIDKKLDSIAFCRRLFRTVPAESKFTCLDLTKRVDELENILLDSYDIVLFLAVYHTIEKKMSREKLDKFMNILLKKTNKWLAVRQDSHNREKIRSLILSRGFTLRYSDEGTNNAGPLDIYEKTSLA